MFARAVAVAIFWDPIRKCTFLDSIPHLLTAECSGQDPARYALWWMVGFEKHWLKAEVSKLWLVYQVPPTMSALYEEQISLFITKVYWNRAIPVWFHTSVVSFTLSIASSRQRSAGQLSLEYFFSGPSRLILAQRPRNNSLWPFRKTKKKTLLNFSL